MNKRQRLRVQEVVQVTPTFRTLVGQLVAHHGSMAAAAAAFRKYARHPHRDIKDVDLAVSQPTLSRIISGKEQRVTWRVFFALKIHGLHAGIDGDWAGAVFSPAARQALDQYYEWWHAERRRINPSGRALYRLEDKLRAWDDGPRSASQLLEGFRRWLTHEHPLIGTDRIRHRMAIARALEPLLVADRAGGLERTAEELHRAGQLNAYVRVAIEREKILLRREPDARRAQKLFPHPDHTV